MSLFRHIGTYCACTHAYILDFVPTSDVLTSDLMLREISDV